MKISVTLNFGDYWNTMDFDYDSNNETDRNEVEKYMEKKFMAYPEVVTEDAET